MTTEIRVNATKLEFIDGEVTVAKTLKELDDAVKLTGASTKAGVLTLSDTPKMDAIAEKTAATGVTVDGVKFKDGAIYLGSQEFYMEYLTEKISFSTGAGTIATPRVNFATGEGTVTCEKISFPLYAAYKVVAITLKCGTAITDKLKLRRIQ